MNTENKSNNDRQKCERGKRRAQSTCALITHIRIMFQSG